MECLFCGIVAGSVPGHRIYEDEAHIAFLDIYPASRGQTLVVPRAHRPSDVLGLPEDEFRELMEASRRVADRLRSALGCQRVALVAEGMEIDHAHVKLYPIHRIGRLVAEGTFDMNEYPGYLCTLHGERAAPDDLAAVAAAVRTDDPGAPPR
ncbi:MAG TPA: HIT domain-containing protein [Longimicrobiaceae bacterium]|nr:HIT domain-containing protein [Longimicrobiaceae bacterium]